MVLHAIQKDMAVPCKCGIEPRPNIAASYGGYFYNRSFDAGLEMKDRVREIITEKISPDVPVFLKRGCTGIEEDFGPSNKWKMAEGQAELEAKLDKLFDDSFKDPQTAPQPDDLAREIFETWLHYAHSVGDMSYLQITKGRYLHTPAVTYNKDSKF